MSRAGAVVPDRLSANSESGSPRTPRATPDSDEGCEGVACDGRGATRNGVLHAGQGICCPANAAGTLSPRAQWGQVAANVPPDEDADFAAAGAFAFEAPAERPDDDGELMAAGTVVAVPHAGHFTRLPASASGARSGFRHPGQTTAIGIVIPAIRR